MTERDNSGPAGEQNAAGARQIAGYRIEGYLGRGAMGVVYKARQLSLNRTVALKVLHKPTVTDDSYVARFVREARNAARLQHPNIVQAIDAGEDGDFCYFAMEFIDGRDLGALLREKGRFEPVEAARVAQCVAAALEYAWRRANMIHRDIKPTNILLDRDGNVKLVDMGLAKATEDTLITSHGAVLGTLAYMSPEQLEDSDSIDPRTDIYSLGCTLYQMLTGAAPYESKTRLGVMTGHLSSPPPDPRAKVPDVPEELARYVMRMMAKKPEDRPQSGAEVAQFMGELIEALTGRRAPSGTGRIELVSPCSAVSARQEQFARESGFPVARQLTLGPEVALDLVLVPPGTFGMGSPAGEEGRNPDEGPLHSVKITRPFYVGVFEVTQVQYETVMGEDPSRVKGPHHPVERVSWIRAAEFCEKASEVSACHVRLPTEAQWEYACRAGTRTPFSFSEVVTGAPLAEHAWYCDNSGFRTHAVGKLRPNPWGLYDMHGNVWEWCADWYAQNYYRDSPPADPEGPPTGSRRILRGGSCLYYPRFLRCANRSWAAPEEESGNIGFRVVVDAGGSL